MGKATFKEVLCTFCHGQGDTEEGFTCPHCMGTGKTFIKIEPEPTEEEWSRGEE